MSKPSAPLPKDDENSVSTPASKPPATNATYVGTASATSITVKGTGTANLGLAAIPATVATVDAAANSGGVSLTLSGANTAVSNGIKFASGTGNDVVTTNGLGVPCA